MKKLLSLLLALSLVLALGACGSSGELSGSGTEEDPYCIATADDLRLMAELINSKDTNKEYASAHYRLTADIDLGGSKKWTPMGDDSLPFRGVLDGDGHTIRGILVDCKDSLLGETARYCGLIGNLYNGTVRNLTISDSSFSATGDSTICAAVVAYTYGGTIENCHTTDSVTVSGSSKVAGIVGQANTDNPIRNCTNAAAVSADSSVSNAAGIVAWADCAVVDCANTAAITGSADCAGITVAANGGVSGCTNSGTITAGKGYAAGIICRFEDGALNSRENNAEVTLENCVNTGAVTSQEEIAGGIAASCRTGIVRNCENSGDVTAAQEAGGIFGYFQVSPFGTPAETFTVQNCTNSGAVTSVTLSGSNVSGGICGQVYGGKDTTFLFENCVNTGSVLTQGQTGVADTWGPAGGIIGSCEVRSIRLVGCENRGTVQGFHTAGGIVGAADVVNYEEAADASFLAENCTNAGSVYAVDGGGLTMEVYAGGILGYQDISEADTLRFAAVEFPGCTNSGPLDGDHTRVPLCADDLCASDRSQIE